jgi:hypothetical protein
MGDGRTSAAGELVTAPRRHRGRQGIIQVPPGTFRPLVVAGAWLQPAPYSPVGDAFALAIFSGAVVVISVDRLDLV